RRRPLHSPIRMAPEGMFDTAFTAIRHRTDWCVTANRRILSRRLVVRRLQQRRIRPARFIGRSDGRDQPIALARYVGDVRGRGVLIAKQFSQLRYGLVERRRSHNHAWPHVIEQLLRTDDLTWP